MTKIKIIKMLNAIIRQVVLSNFFLPLGHKQGSLALVPRKTANQSSLKNPLKERHLPFFIKERKIRSNG